MAETITEPDFSVEADGIALSGEWTLDHGRRLEAHAARLAQALAAGGRRVALDMSRVERLDTLGAHIVEKAMHFAGTEGVKVDLVRARPEHAILIEAVSRPPERAVPPRRSRFVDILVDVGEGVVNFGRDIGRGVSFIGEVVVSIGRVIRRPWTFRGASFVNQFEQIAFRGAPIIVLISFLVGCIVAQQGIFQLRRFGATAFVVDLVGIITLRELALLLTAIMVAGRSGSAFTAEIGSMKMREEVDALRVMGLNPVDVLVTPRVLALIVALPFLTFLAGMAGLFGAGLVAWLYGGINPDTYLARLQSVINYRHFSVGLIKAPFMALVIGAIACIEGLNVKGSAESLGRQVTASVVKAIFMVIVVDGLFAMFFASIRY